MNSPAVVSPHTCAFMI